MSSLRQEFQISGYANIPSVFSQEEMSEIRENLERYMRDIAPGLKEPLAFFSGGEDEALPRETIFLGRMNLQDAYFDHLRLDQRLKKIAEDLLGCEVEPQHVQMLNIVPGVCQPTPPHQDAPIFSIEPNHAVTFWIPIGDVDEESGCLHYVPGSHWQGYLEHASSGSRRLVNCENYVGRGIAMPVKSGGMVAHHSLTIHYSSENVTPENRWALAVHFFPVGWKAAASEEEWIRQQSAVGWG